MPSTCRVIVSAGRVGVVSKVLRLMVEASWISEEVGWLSPGVLADVLVQLRAFDLDIFENFSCVFLGQETSVVAAVVAQSDKAHRYRVAQAEGSGRAKSSRRLYMRALKALDKRALRSVSFCHSS